MGLCDRCGSRCIRQGTTPMQLFIFPVDPTQLNEIEVTYEQQGQILFVRTKNDFTFDENNRGYFYLTQEETFQLKKNTKVQVQLRALKNDHAVATTIWDVPVKESLNKDILEV